MVRKQEVFLKNVQGSAEDKEANLRVARLSHWSINKSIVIIAKGTNSIYGKP